MRGETLPAVVTLADGLFEQDVHLLLERDPVEYFFLDNQFDFQVLGIGVCLDPTRLYDLDELERVDLAQTQLQQFLAIPFAVVPLVVLVQMSVTHSTLVHCTFGGNSLCNIYFFGQTSLTRILCIALYGFTTQATED